MSVTSVDEYVCPQCGASAAGNNICAVCAQDLDAFETLPLRSEYQAGTGVAAPRRLRSRWPFLAPLLRKLAQALRNHPEIASVVISLIPLLSLSMTWFELEGTFLLIFGDVGDPWLTGWEAFGWHDVMLAVIAVALAAAMVVQRRLDTLLALPVGVAVLGLALAAAMIASPPAVSAEQQNYSGGQYVSTGRGWIAVAGFAVAAVTSGLRWRRLSAHGTPLGSASEGEPVRRPCPPA